MRHVCPHLLILGAATVQQLMERPQVGAGGCGNERVHHPRAFPRIGDQTRMSQRRQMPGHTRLWYLEHGLQVTYADATEAKQIQEAQARMIRGGLENFFQPF
jgi:hypothetical protein